MRRLNNILITGGAGFIGSNFIHYLFGLSNSGTSLFNDANFTGNIINIDSLTYAGNLDSLKDVDEKYGGKRYFFEKIDITNRKEVERIFNQYNIDTVIHFAAESHVDRSILNPESFIKTNIIGTYTLLDVARTYWNCTLDNIREDVLFHHISTDEVYGTLGNTGCFEEITPYNPRSPYSASKASSDYLAMSYYYTFGLPVTISNCSNNYGPFQHPEKFIPLMITNIKAGKELPVYGCGNNIRDWIYVEDHNRGVWKIVNNSPAGQKWNLGGENEIQNIELLNRIIKITSEKLKLDTEKVCKKIVYIKDRPGHDKRYAINCNKAKTQLQWEPRMNFAEGLSATINWYLNNEQWIKNIEAGTYIKWISTNYKELESYNSKN